MASVTVAYTKQQVTVQGNNYTVTPAVTQQQVQVTSLVKTIGAAETLSSENKQGATVYAGQAAALHSSGTGIVLADASSVLTPALGIITADAAAGIAAEILTEGIVTLADWTAATGAASLTPNAVYYLSTTAGLLTVTAPSTAGHYLQYIGRAITAQKLDISITQPIRRG